MQQPGYNCRVSNYKLCYRKNAILFVKQREKWDLFACQVGGLRP